MTPQTQPGTLFLTEDLLRSFAMELTLSVASVFQQLTNVDIDREKLVTAVTSVADRVVTKLVEKSKILSQLQAPTPAPSLTATVPTPDKITKATGTRPKGTKGRTEKIVDGPTLTDAAESASVSGTAKE